MTELVNQPVAMIVHHLPGKRTVPAIMMWDNRTYKFTRFGFWHTLYEGKKLLHIFSMADDTMSYRLEYDSHSLNWVLKEISDGLPG